MISVLHVIAPGPLAGAERVVLAGVAALTPHVQASLGVFVESRAPEHGTQFIAEARRRGIESMPLECSGRVDPALIVSLARSFRRERWDVVHVHGYKALTYALLAGAPATSVLTATHHGDTAATGAVRTYERASLALYRGTSRVFAVCQDAADRLAHAGVPRSLLEVVLNPAEFGPPPGPAPTGPTVLLFAGRLVPEKGLDVLLRALITTATPRIELHICGDGPTREALERQATPLGSTVQFHGWVDDVGARLAHAHALVLPSLREGLPMIVLQALAAGRPVLATTVGGVHEVVDSGRTGLLAAPGDVADFAHILARYLADRAGFDARARADVASFRERLGPARWALETTAAYERLLASRTGLARRFVSRLRATGPRS